MTYTIESHYKLPKRRKAKAVPDNVRKAYDEYAEAFKRVYGVSPKGFKYDKATGYVYIEDLAGVKLQRLKELTRMLRQRVG